MTTLNTHLGTNLPWVAYKLGGNTFTIDLSASGVDLSGYTFVVNITKTGDTTNVLQLTQGGGITNNGAAGTLDIDLTKAKIDASLPGYDYWYEIAYTVGGVVAPLFQGTLQLSNRKNPGSPTTITPTVNLGGNTVNVSVTLLGFDVASLTDAQKSALWAALAPYALGG